MPVPTRLASGFPHRRVAVVLAGGGTLGAYEAGVLKVLSEAGLEPAVLAGTSAGAINAVAWLAHGFRSPRLERTWRSVRPASIGMRWTTLALRAAGATMTTLGLLLAVLALLGSPDIVVVRRLWGGGAAEPGVVSVLLDAAAWFGVAVLGWLAIRLSRPAEDWLARFEGAVDPGRSSRWLGRAVIAGGVIHLVAWSTGTPWPHGFSATVIVVAGLAWLASRPGAMAARIRRFFGQLMPETQGRGLWRGAARRRLVEELVRSGDPTRLTHSRTLLVVTALAVDTGRIAYFVSGPDPGPEFVARVEAGLGEVIRLSSPEEIIEAVTASSAIPLMFEPVRLRGREFVDSGQFSNQPLAAVYAAHADAAVVVLLTPQSGPPPVARGQNLVALGARLLEIGNWRSMQQELSELPDAWVAGAESSVRRVVVVAPATPLEGGLLTFAPGIAAELVARGEADARQALAAAGWLEGTRPT